MSALPAYVITDDQTAAMIGGLQEKGLEAVMTRDCLQRNQKDGYREWRLSGKAVMKPLVIWFIRPLDETEGVLTVGPCPTNDPLFKVLDEVLRGLGAERLSLHVEGENDSLPSMKLIQVCCLLLFISGVCEILHSTGTRPGTVFLESRPWLTQTGLDAGQTARIQEMLNGIYRAFVKMSWYGVIDMVLALTIFALVRRVEWKRKQKQKQSLEAAPQVGP